MFCDNEYVYKNVATPELTLKKKNISICHHKYREDVSAGVARIPKEGTATNVYDMFTNMLVKIRRETFLDKFPY